MKQPGSELKQDLEKGLSRLQTLRDEVRVRMHLAGMDAKEQWEKLQTHLEDVERNAASQATEASRTAVEEAIKRLQKLREMLH